MRFKHNLFYSKFFFLLFGFPLSCDELSLLKLVSHLLPIFILQPLILLLCCFPFLILLKLGSVQLVLKVFQLFLLNSASLFLQKKLFKDCFLCSTFSFFLLLYLICNKLLFLNKSQVNLVFIFLSSFS